MSLRKVSLVLVAVALIAGGAWVANLQAEPEAATYGMPAADDGVQIASLIHELDSMDEAEFYSLEPLKVQKFHIPPDSVDVMRARISETYHVDGIGEDTVELAGWVAVKHFNARPIEGETELNWQTAVVDTEFVGMDLTGESELFGRVEVKLNTERPSRGQVGRIEIPELARVALLAELKTEEVSPEAAATEPRATNGELVAPGRESGGEAGTELDLETGSIDSAACVAPTEVVVSMPDLDLEMKTSRPVHWYSLVETIPPVGHVASIAVEPVRMVSEGREVATLKGGKVHFREIVRAVVLNPTDDVRIADN